MPAFDLDGAKIAYRRRGVGEPVVLLHSSTGSGAQWTALCDELQQDFLVLTPDLYGYGDSDGWPGDRAISLSDEAAIVEGLAQICPGPIHLVGHSYGGAVALKAALRGNIALRSLTVIEPVAFHVLRNSDPWGNQYLDQIGDVAEFVQSALARGNRNAAMQHFVDFWSGPGVWSSLSPGQRQRIIAVAPKVPLDFWATLSETATLEDYGALTLPTLLICGADSPASSRRIVSLLDLALSDCRLNVVPGAGHMLPLTHSESVNRTISAHLRHHRSVCRGPVRCRAA